MLDKITNLCNIFQQKIAYLKKVTHWSVFTTFSRLKMNKFVFGAVIFKVGMVRIGNFGSDFSLECPFYHFILSFMSKVKSFKFFVLKHFIVAKHLLSYHQGSIGNICKFEILFWTICNSYSFTNSRLVLRLLSSGSLLDIIRGKMKIDPAASKAGVLDEVSVATVLKEVLKGLEYLHNNGKKTY